MEQSWAKATRERLVLRAETEQKKSALLEAADRSLGMVTRKLFNIFAPTVVVCLALSVASAQESVSVSGGFTSFSGVILGNNTAYINGAPYCPDAGCNVAFGPATVTFLTPQLSLDFFNKQGSFEDIHNLVQFTPAPAQSVSGKGVPFLLGTFTIANGVWSGDADFGFSLTTSSTTPNSPLDGQTFTGFLHMALTPNSTLNTPQQNADIYYVNNATGTPLFLNQMQVYELADSPTGSDAGTADLFGQIGSLDLTALSNPQGALFLGPPPFTYKFTGFFQPVDNLPTVNTVKAGSAVPVKFSLGGNQGLNILAAGYPLSSQIACNSSATLDQIEQTVTAGSSSLSYDATSDQYTYVWKTDKSWAGSCRQLTVKLNDGTSHQANLEFKK
jgi:hypothetical protein